MRQRTINLLKSDKKKVQPAHPDENKDNAKCLGQDMFIGECCIVHRDAYDLMMQKISNGPVRSRTP